MYVVRDVVAASVSLIVKDVKLLVIDEYSVLIFESHPRIRIIHLPVGHPTRQ